MHIVTEWPVLSQSLIATSAKAGVRGRCGTNDLGRMTLSADEELSKLSATEVSEAASVMI